MFSKFFIERPIFATVVSLLIVVAGLVSMAVLPVAQYPTITPVQVQVTTTYPGADAKTVGDSVAAPIEAQINGVDNMLYMTSISSNTGQLTITVYFTLDMDPDMAQVQVQNRVNLALPQLPKRSPSSASRCRRSRPSILMIVALFDKEGRYTPEYVTNYVNVYVLDAIKRIEGAGQAQIFGMPDQAMRIWMNPNRMASLGITTSDIASAVSSQNALVSAGQINAEPNAGNVKMTFPVVTQAPYTEPSRYEDIILRANPDGSAIVRVKDVARAETGAAPVHRRQQVQRQGGHPDRHLPAARRKRAEGVRRGAQDHGGAEEDPAGGHRLRHRARHHRFRAPLDRGSDPRRPGTPRARRSDGPSATRSGPSSGHRASRGDRRPSG